jgi:hypothetical protein
MNKIRRLKINAGRKGAFSLKGIWHDLLYNVFFIANQRFATKKSNSAFIK